MQHCVDYGLTTELNFKHVSIKMHFKLSPLIEWIALWIVNTYSEFEVNIFSNNKDNTKCQSFSKSNEGHYIILKKKKHFELSPSIAWIALWIMNM